MTEDKAQAQDILEEVYFPTGLSERTYIWVINADEAEKSLND